MHLWDALCRAYAAALGFDHATGGDEVFRDLVLTRIIEPTSKQDPLRVLAETGVEPVSYRTVTRRLPAFAKHTLRQALHPMAVMPRRPLVDLQGQGDFADAIQHW